MNLTLTITRTSLSLPDLVITNDPFGAKFWLPEDGLEEPATEMRLTYFPDAADIAGKKLRAAVEEQSAIPAIIYTQAADSAALKANKAELRAAVSQFNFDTTLDLDGAADTYSGMVRGRIARASVLIPVYPIPS